MHNSYPTWTSTSWHAHEKLFKSLLPPPSCSMHRQLSMPSCSGSKLVMQIFFLLVFAVGKFYVSGDMATWVNGNNQTKCWFQQLWLKSHNFRGSDLEKKHILMTGIMASNIFLSFFLDGTDTILYLFSGRTAVVVKKNNYVLQKSGIISGTYTGSYYYKKLGTGVIFWAIVIFLWRSYSVNFERSKCTFQTGISISFYFHQDI